jgi:hypothetical protein
MARFAVAGDGGEPEAPTGNMMSPQLLAMMQAMAAQAGATRNPAQKNVLYTDTPGALDDAEVSPGSAECDELCRLRNREAQGTDALTQLQRPATPESVEEFALLANTVPPRANVGGVLYYPLGKLAEVAGISQHAKKGRLVRVTVSVMGAERRFEMPVE